MTATQDKWRSYLSAECQTEIDGLASRYPDRRSLYVDILDVYDFDNSFGQSIFRNPEASLSKGCNVLRDVADISGPVYIRIENNPQQRPVSSIHASHTNELVTVEAFVESIGPVEAKAVVGTYSCPNCDNTIKQPESRIVLDPPEECDRCGYPQEFEFCPSDSYFVNLQEVTLVEAAPRRASGSRHTLTGYLKDDLVGDLEESQTCCLTGIVRVSQQETSNQFRLYLDVNSVRPEAKQPPAMPEDVSAALDTHWQGIVK